MNPQRGSRTVIGGMLVILGIALLLMNAGVIEHVSFWRFWPVILIIVGAGKLLQPDGSNDHWSGLWLVLLGTWFQMVTLHVFGFTYWNSWPVLLIIWGLTLAGRALIREPHMTFAKENGNGN